MRTGSRSTSSSSAAWRHSPISSTAPPAPGESGDGWAGGETTRFGRFALRLWTGLLAAEEVRDR